MGAVTKAELEAQNKRLQRSLERSEAKNITLTKSLDRAKTKNKVVSQSLKEALEREKATGEILKLISRSPTDTQPVLDAIVKSCARLFGSANSTLRLIRDKRSEEVASTLPISGQILVLSIDDDGLPGARAVAHREVVHVPDVLMANWVSARFRETAKLRGFRAIIVAPLLRNDEAIGSINVTRPTPGPFSEREIALLQTFADQAVIAIENVRLFNEIQDKNRQLEVANRHKSEFLANMSHELRTPLNAVNGFSEVLQQCMVGELNDKQGEYVS